MSESRSVLAAIVVTTSILLAVVIFDSSEAASESSGGTMSQGSLYKGSGPHPSIQDASEHSQTVESSDSGPLSVLRGTSLGMGLFDFEVPADGRYSLRARWPTDESGGRPARFGVETGSGMQWTRVRPPEGEDSWVEIGVYELREGERRVLQMQLAPFGDNPAVAGSIKVEGGQERTGLVADEPSEASTEEAEGSGDYGTMSTSKIAPNRLAVRRAKRHIGTRYRLSPPAPCRAHKVEDCSCHTRLVFNKWRKLPDHPAKQWRYGKKVRRKANLRLGDLVFFKERGRKHPITHVGIYSGRGNLVHASSYYGKVVESKMKYINGYVGARRVVSNRA